MIYVYAYIKFKIFFIEKKNKVLFQPRLIDEVINYKSIILRNTEEKNTRELISNDKNGTPFVQILKIAILNRIRDSVF